MVGPFCWIMVQPTPAGYQKFKKEKVLAKPGLFFMYYGPGPWFISESLRHKRQRLLP